MVLILKKRWLANNQFYVTLPLIQTISALGCIFYLLTLVSAPNVACCMQLRLLGNYFGLSQPT